MVMAAPNPVIPSMAGAGLAQAAGQNFDQFSALLRDLAFFNLQAKKQQEMQGQEQMLREVLQQRALEQEGAMQASRIAHEQQMQADRLAQEERLANRTLSAQEKRDSKENEAAIEREATTLNERTGLGYSTIYTLLKQGNRQGIFKALEQQDALETDLYDSLGDENKQRATFGRKLRDSEKQRFEMLFQKARENPAVWRPRLQAEFSKLQEEIMQKQAEPGFFESLFGGGRSGNDRQNQTNATPAQVGNEGLARSPIAEVGSRALGALSPLVTVPTRAATSAYNAYLANPLGFAAGQGVTQPVYNPISQGAFSGFQAAFDPTLDPSQIFARSLQGFYNP